MKRSQLLGLLVVLAAALAYAATLGYGFVWDDPILIRDRVHLYTWSTLPELLASEFFSSTTQKTYYYRPTVTLSFFLDLKLWGLRPFGFHLTNVLAHALVSLAVFWLARRVARDDMAALVAGLAFALHPVHSESVAFISGRTDVLAALFLLWALLAYARWRESGRIAWGTGSLGAFALAVLSKEVAIVLPALLALYDWAVCRDLRSPRETLAAGARYAPYAAVALGYVALRQLAMGHVVDTASAPWADGMSRLLTGLKLAGWYARIMLVPYPENLYYLVPVDSPPPGLVWWVAITWLAALLALTLIAVVRWPAAAFGALWFWIALAPAVGINLLPVAKAIMAERFLYLPSVGFCLLAGLVAARLLGPVRWERNVQLPAVPAVGLALLLLVLAGSTLWRNEAWMDEFRLNTRMVETSPDAPLPHYNLGLTYLRQASLGLSHAHLTAAVERAPGNAWILASLGFVNTLLGDREKGLEQAQWAHAREPENPIVLGILGDVHRERGEPEKAVPLLERSLEIKPHQVAVNLNLAAILAHLERLDEADVALTRARDINSGMRIEPETSFDRVAAEILMKRDPAQGRLAWERYVQRLRSIPQPTSRQQVDLASAERRLALLSKPASR